MYLILEGPDHAGKTTLARYLVSTTATQGLSVAYHHPGGPPEDLISELACHKEQILRLDGTSVILDRVTAISQQVYSPDKKLDPIRQLAMTGLLSKSPVVIYCRPTTDHLMRKEDFHWRDGETEEHKQRIIRDQHAFIDHYDRVMMTVPHIQYDFEDASQAEGLRKMLLKGFTNDPLTLNELHRLTYKAWER